MPELNTESIALGQDERLRAMLREICDATGMGFAAVARVTEHRWIACQVEDRIEFGLEPGGELKVRETICDEIRDSGEAILFDDASDDIKWSRHPVPVLEGEAAPRVRQRNDPPHPPQAPVVDLRRRDALRREVVEEHDGVAHRHGAR